MKSLRFFGLLLTVSLLVGSEPLRAQARAATDAKRDCAAAMQAELAADLNDHSRWRYRDAQRDRNDSVSIVVRDGSWFGEAADQQGWAAA